MFAALAVSHWIEAQTGWSIKKFVRTTRRYRTVQIKIGRRILTAADPLPADLREAIAKIESDVRHQNVLSRVLDSSTSARLAARLRRERLRRHTDG